MLMTGLIVISALVCLVVFMLRAVRLVWLPAVFAGSFVAGLLLWIAFCFVVTRLVDMDTPCTIPSSFYRRCADVTLEFIMQFLRMDVTVSGEQLLPQEKFMLAGNHRSVFDPMLAMLFLSEYNMGFVAKKEVSGYPVASRLMHKCFCLPLDHSSLKSEARTINTAASLISSDTASIGIYPEGARNTADEMLPFMAGAFRMAKKADCPIVVAAIRGTDKVMRNFLTFRRTDITMEYVGVVDRDEVRSNSTLQLSDMTREMLEQALA